MTKNYAYYLEHLDEAKTRTLFHMAWTYASDCPNYNKRLWQELRARLNSGDIKEPL